MRVTVMNPFFSLCQRWAARKRRRTAIRMLMASGTIRRGDRTVRYGMTPKELAQLLREETV